MRAKPADAEINRGNRPSFNVSSAAEGARALPYRASVARMSVESESLAERTYARLRHGLIVGQIAPGECFTLGLLARQFGTSVTPVRDALSQLAAADALHHSRQSGVVAPVLSCSELDELLQLRLSIEGVAFANVAPHYRASDWRGFKVLHADLVRVAEFDDSTRFAAAVWPLRRAILGVARSGVLSMLLERIWCRLGPTFTQRAADIAQRRRISYLLGTVVTAIGRRDLEQARKALVEEIVAGTLPCGGAAEPSAPSRVPSDRSAHRKTTRHCECGAGHE
jgi:DNA-binding GntR family transcriptional regulator